MKKFHKLMLVKVTAMITLILPVLVFFGCGGATTGSGGTGSISGVVTDSSGNGIGGATVVAGSSSPTALTDKDGNFTVSGVPAGSVSVNVITPGYNTNNFSVHVDKDMTTTIPAAIHLPDVDDMNNAPLVTNASATYSNGAFTVTATITPTTGLSIADARAELVGYGTGTILTSGTPYSGEISLPSGFVGPSAVIKIFAIDSKGRVGVDVQVVPVPGAPGTGSFSAGTLIGVWGGNAEYHHPSFGNGDLLGDKRYSNVSFTITSPSSVTAKAANINIESYMPPSAWGVTTNASTTAQTSLIDASMGIYEVTSSFQPSSSRTITVDMLGRLDSAIAPTSFVGYFKAKIVDTNPPAGTTVLLGHFTLKNGLTWVNSDLDGNWVWSEFIKTSAINTTYLAPFQFTSSFTGTSGVFAGKDTLGYSLSNSVNFGMIDASIGYFGGTVSSSDGSTASFVGLMGPYKRHMTGLLTISSGGNNAYGPFWGGKVLAPPLYATSDFAQKRFDGSTVPGIWRGFYYVTGSSHAGSLCYLSLSTDASGAVVGGQILQVMGTCPSVTLAGGSLSFTDFMDGQVSGSANNGGTVTFTLAPTGSRNASMGVYKERLTGDFLSGSDTGFFFLQRVLI